VIGFSGEGYISGLKKKDGWYRYKDILYTIVYRKKDIGRRVEREGNGEKYFLVSVGLEGD